MRAAVYHSNDDVRLEERERPRAGRGELVMRIEASGICGSDVMEWYRRRKAPVVLGHEVAGVVAELGDGVERFRVGDRIVTTHHVPCNACRYCLTGRHSVCPTLRSTSFDPGGFAEFLRLPAINVERGTFVLPDAVDFVEATFVEPLACAVRAVREAGLAPGDAVAVLGAGVSGILMLQLARTLGAGPIVATDVAPYRLEAALRFGADAAIPAVVDDVAGAIREALSGRAPERVLVCTAAPAAFEQAFRAVDAGGAVLLFAPLAPGTEVPVPLHDLWVRCVRIVHSYAGPPADMRAALDLIAARRIDVGAMVTHRLPLAETAAGFRRMVEGGDSLKIVIEPQR